MNAPADAFLEGRLERYDRWLAEGRIPVSSRVIPIRESLSALQWVLPSEQVLEFLRNARSFAVTHCTCRTHYARTRGAPCEHPTENCFLINDAADAQVAAGVARRLSLPEAEAVLRQANEHGLVHLTIYNPHQYVYAICSCCACCCHDLRFLSVYGRTDMVARSEYVAQTDAAACVHCGACVPRCVFGARTWENGEMVYDPQICYGCGLCVSACSIEATTMVRRAQQPTA
jgi:Pyruvate/2-oxoacid:ferredoxin oxidoreductase delta subunit